MFEPNQLRYCYLLEVRVTSDSTIVLHLLLAMAAMVAALGLHHGPYHSKNRISIPYCLVAVFFKPFLESWSATMLSMFRLTILGISWSPTEIATSAFLVLSHDVGSPKPNLGILGAPWQGRIGKFTNRTRQSWPVSMVPTRHGNPTDKDWQDYGFSEQELGAYNNGELTTVTTVTQNWILRKKSGRINQTKWGMCVETHQCFFWWGWILWKLWI